MALMVFFFSLFRWIENRANGHFLSYRSKNKKFYNHSIQTLPVLMFGSKRIVPKLSSDSVDVCYG